jgi:starch phosphorylase
MLLPRHLEIIYEINRRLPRRRPEALPGDEGRVARVSLIEEGPTKHVRMANLAIVGSHSTNGVAAIHSKLLRTTTVKDLAEMFPERFSNKTNGVTPRRWLLLANPALARTITEAIGDGWITDLSQLRKLKPLADDKAFATPSARPSARPRRSSPTGSRRHTGRRRPDTIFDCQIKRIHEYKRQLLNALRIVVLYNRLRANPDLKCRRGRSSSPARRRRPTIWPSSSSSSSTTWPHHRRRPGGARKAQGGVPARIQRHAGRAADSRQRRLQPDLDRRLRGQRHQQHEVHDERRADARHARRRDHRDGEEAGEENFFLFGLTAEQVAEQPRLVQPALALRNEPETRAALDLIGAGSEIWGAKI